MCKKVKVEPGKMADFENTMWNVDMEVNLFHAMRRHKPVGVNRYFQMMFIHDKLNNSSSRKITSKQIWKHLLEMYDLQALNESEIIPFPNRETEFTLPDSEYHSLIEKSYPRFEGNVTGDEVKSEKSEGKSSKEGKGSSSGDKSKSDSKSSSKSDSKSSSTPKESKSEGRGSSTPHGKDKSEGKGKDSSKGSSTPHGKDNKGDNKGSSTPLSSKGGKSSSQSGASAASTPESTPKRKRTRQTNSANASPATPSESHPTKRGRR